MKAVSFGCLLVEAHRVGEHVRFPAQIENVEELYERVIVDPKYTIVQMACQLFKKQQFSDK